MINVVFMGTPDFAVPSLEKLVENENINVQLVVTKPDKYRGKKSESSYSEVKQCALKHNLEIFTPDRIKEHIEFLKSYNPDFIIVVAYGQILPKEILDIPKYACINVHGSLLPEYRGASPIHYSLLNGDKVTGVTTMLMDVGMDTGDMLLKKELVINDDDNIITLYEKLSLLGSELLIETIDKFITNDIKPIKQDDNKATYTKIIKKEMGVIDFNKTAREIKNMYKAYFKWPEIYTYYKGKQLKLKEIDIVSEELEFDEVGVIIDNIDSYKKTFEKMKKKIYITTKKGLIEVKKLQLEGKKEMDSVSFLNGNQIFNNDVIGK